MTTAEKQQTGAEDILWNLSDLYAAPDDPKIDADIAASLAQAKDFTETYHGRIAELSAAELNSALSAYEGIMTLLTRLISYAHLIWSTETQNPELGKLLARLQQHGAKVEQMVLFFTLEWANAPDASVMDDPAVAGYRHFLEVARLYQPYTLSEPEEKIISQMDLIGSQGWTRYFSELTSNLRFPFDGEELTQSEVLSKMYDVDRDVRRRAAESVSGVMQQNQHATTYIFNMILLDKASKDEMRGYQSWVASRNMANQVDDETVDALVDAVSGRYDVVARYYRLLKNVLGLDELYDYDRYAPIEKVKRAVAWDDARALVLNAFTSFDGQMADIASEFFEKNWIDAAIKPGKRGGAYSASTSVDAHPYVFMNYDGDARSVMTLAHELGHGVHQYLARGQGELLSNTPLTTAEMASTFGEMLVFDHLTAREDNPAVRLSMRMEKIASAIATIFRQIAMNRFENAIHTARREQGELNTEQLCDFWQQTQQAMFQDSLIIRDDYRLWWSYVPHFLHTPGYVYAYSFGELLVWALYARYQASSNGFASSYLDVLRAGGSDYPHQILAPLNVDLKDPQFWHEGLGLIDDFIAQTEADAAAL
jgi:oligoendopeptidase F